MDLVNLAVAVVFVSNAIILILLVYMLIRILGQTEQTREMMVGASRELGDSARVVRDAVYRIGESGRDDAAPVATATPVPGLEMLDRLDQMMEDLARHGGEGTEQALADIKRTVESMRTVEPSNLAEWHRKHQTELEHVLAQRNRLAGETEQMRQRLHEAHRIILELRRANEELTRLSYFDALTELANRRRLIERLHAEWAIGLARGTPVAFALFDLDEFKAYNDHKGHLAGDEALRVVARRVEAELRKPHDTAGRYGGEEFGLLLPGLEMPAAMAVAERVRQAVLHADLPHPASRLGMVTVSIGVAAIVPRAGLSPELLIAAADAALYRAKQSGKNRVEAAESLD